MSEERELCTRRQIHTILHPLLVKDMVERWLREDTPNFDLAAMALPNMGCAMASLIAKEVAILAGKPFAEAIFKTLECESQWFINDGEETTPFKCICTVTGKPSDLLLAERIVLNCLSRASGVATVSNRVKRTLQNKGWLGEVVATRKTTPGFRMVEKYATLVGGIGSHRYDLSSMIMLKDNHVKLSGSITEAVKLAKVVGGFHTKIEVECGSLEEALEAANSGCDIIMLDNFEPVSLHETARKVKERFPAVLIESSGGVNEDNIVSYVGEFIDVVSSSMFVQGYKTIDFSMKIVT